MSSQPADQSTLWPEAPPASPSAPRARASRKPMSAGSGPKWSGWWVDYDPATSCWKTPRRSLDGASETFSEAWPRSGTTRSGHASALPTSALRISGIASGLWPTPDANLGTGGKTLTRDTEWRGATPYTAAGRKQQLSLSVAVKMRPTPAAADGERHSATYMGGNPTLTGAARGLWPTPTVKGNYSRVGASATSGDGLATAVVEADRWPTPTFRDGTGRSAQAKRWGDPARHGGWNLDDRVRAEQEDKPGQLNPSWVECLMGLPPDWTATDGPPLRTPPTAARSTTGSHPAPSPPGRSPTAPGA